MVTRHDRQTPINEGDIVLVYYYCKYSLMTRKLEKAYKYNKPRKAVVKWTYHQNRALCARVEFIDVRKLPDKIKIRINRRYRKTWIRLGEDVSRDCLKVIYHSSINQFGKEAKEDYPF